ncbi:Bug family tripartite tricarboxylate transporter substrate binding protein [Elioraea rosea]|uniref:Bug family tripartite tricarboxylate transporter substrate binding protein n=1 Tax=Elioraea rosea TaxID=2492390 RepID=UPI0013152D11|nr:tripartite tricarboxylate transporter substrate binding protein [Elioraea rosea]
MTGETAAIRAPLRRRTLLAAAAAASIPVRAHAQGAGAWPNGPIRFVVPFAPGGTTDIMARLVGERLQARLGVPVVVENRAGAGATVGSQMVASAPPDGQTIVMSNIASHAISPSVYRGVRYDPVKDFAHIAMVTVNPSVMVANPKFEAQSLAEYIALAKARPGQVNYATSGAGSSNHMIGVRLGLAAGIELVHVPYRGAGPAMTDVIAGVVGVMFDSLPSASSHIRAGSVKALAVSSEERNPAFPDVPTFREQGVDIVSYSWFGISAPAGTPAAIVERLNAETRASIAEPAVAARLDELGGSPRDWSAAEFTAFVAKEYETWAPVVKASGASAQ